MITIYRFTAILTKRPFSQTYKGTVRVTGNAFDAYLVIREIILEKHGDPDDGTSIKITISPTRKNHSTL